MPVRPPARFEQKPFIRKLVYLLAAQLPLVAIMFLDISLDRQPSAAWKGVLTPGAILAVLSRIYEGWVAFVGSSLLFQLSQLETINRAQYLSDISWAATVHAGQFKSLFFLLGAHGFRLARLAAFTNILAPIVGPFVQNVLEIKYHKVSFGEVPVPVAIYYNVSAVGANTQVPDPGELFKGVYVGSLYKAISKLEGITLDVPIVSPTGNASIPDYCTLAVRSLINNRTADIVVSPNATCTHTIPASGPGLCDPGSVLNCSSLVGFEVAGVFANLTQQFSHYQCIARRSDGIIQAIESVKVLVVRKLRTSITKGVKKETILGETHNTSAIFDVSDPSNPYYFAIASDLCDSSVLSGMDGKTVTGIQNYDSSLMTGSIISRKTPEGTVVLSDPSGVLQAKYAAFEQGVVEEQDEFQAKAFSYVIQSGDANNATVIGKVLANEPFWSARFGYLALPISESVLTLALLLLTWYLSLKFDAPFFETSLLAIIAMAPCRRTLQLIYDRYPRRTLGQVALDVRFTVEGGRLELVEEPEGPGRYRKLLKRLLRQDMPVEADDGLIAQQFHVYEDMQV